MAKNSRWELIKNVGGKLANNGRGELAKHDERKLAKNDGGKKTNDTREEITKKVERLLQRMAVLNWQRMSGNWQKNSWGIGKE